MSYLVIREGEAGSLLAGLMNLISVVQKLDDEESSILIRMAGSLAEGIGIAPQFASKADYLHSLKDLEKRLTEQMKAPLAELSRPQMEVVMEAIAQWQERTLRYDSRLLRKLNKLRDASTYSTDEGPPQ